MGTLEHTTSKGMTRDSNSERQGLSGFDAVDEMVRDLYPSLRRYAAVVGSVADDPDDLVQEALAKALRSVASGEVRQPEAYLRRTISNVVIDRHRRRATRRDKQHMVAVDNERNDVYPSDLSVLDHLGPLDRSILYQVDVEGRSFREAAETVGCTTGAARLRASRARRQLRQLLEEQA